MTSAEVKNLTSQYILNTYGRYPVAIERGEGARLYDFEGNEYIDFTSGIGVTCMGYGDPAWAEAIGAQAAKLGHVSNLFYTEPAAKLAEKLCTRTGMSGVFFANGGGEANEGMIKLARKYSFDKYGTGRSTIITLNHSFHGRTITTLKATGQDVFHQFFFPFTEGFRYAAANDLASLEAAAGDDVFHTIHHDGDHAVILDVLVEVERATGQHDAAGGKFVDEAGHAVHILNAGLARGEGGRQGGVAEVRQGSLFAKARLLGRAGKILHGFLPIKWNGAGMVAIILPACKFSREFAEAGR